MSGLRAEGVGSRRLVGARAECGVEAVSASDSGYLLRVPCSDRVDEMPTLPAESSLSA